MKPTKTRLSETFSTTKTPTFQTLRSFCEQLQIPEIQQLPFPEKLSSCNHKNHNFLGISGINKQRSSDQTSAVPPSYLLLKTIGTKYEEIATNIKLSTTSLNSNSSGSSSNSSESNNKNNPTNPSGGDQWESKPWLNSSENSLNVTSTPSESTSELSVLSSNTLVSPVNIPLLNKKGSMVHNSMKPSSSTGAIPKSISFDMSAEKGDRDLDDEGRSSKRGSFFGKLKIGFRNRRGKSRDDYNNIRFDCGDEDGRNKRSEYCRGVASNTGEFCDGLVYLKTEWLFRNFRCYIGEVSIENLRKGRRFRKRNAKEP